MIDIRIANYEFPADALALVTLLDAYARDPVGGGTRLTEEVIRRLPGELAKRPQAFSILAWDAEQPVGLANCFEGFSTFACRPLVNVHDLIVMKSHRGQQVAQRILQSVEHEARQRGACKLTLEVLSENAGAIRLYQRTGFASYQLDPAFGTAVFLQKKLH